MPTAALPSPTKTAPKSRTSAAGGPKSFDAMKAAYQRAQSVKAKMTERKEQITGGLIATAEIQAATFGASFLSGWMSKKGKSMKVMGVDTRLALGAASVIPGLYMEEGGSHFLAVGNGLLASVNAEYAFDLGVRAATPKSDAPATPPVGDDVGDDVGDEPTVRLSGDGSGIEGDEVGRRGGGRRGRRMRRVRRGQEEESNQCPPDDEQEVEGEVGAVNTGRIALAILTGGGSELYRALTPQNKINTQFKAYEHAKKRYTVSKTEGRMKAANRWKSRMAFHKAEGIRVYNKFKAKPAWKGKVKLPSAWKAKAKPALKKVPTEQIITRQQIIRETVYDDGDGDGGDDGGGDDGGDTDFSEDEGSTDFDEAVSNLSEDELSNLAGVDEEIGDGTIDVGELGFSDSEDEDEEIQEHGEDTDY